MASRALIRVFAMLACAAMLALAMPTQTRAADLFGKPAEPSAAPAAAPIMLPAPLRPILAAAVAWQTKMNAAMRAQLLKAREGRSLRPALIIVLFAFLYGVAHAIGPGHGKMVIGSYFLTHRARIAQGIAMSGIAALVQALSAIVLVGILAALLEAGSTAILDEAATIEMVSYGAIVVIGLWMAWGIVTGRKHSHGPDHDHEHDHESGHGPEHKARRVRAQGRRQWLRLLATGAAVGLRPCSGAILVLLFSLANDIVAIGVIATFAMAVGVAITVALVSLTTLGVRHGVAALGGSTRRVAETGYSVVALGGALLIALFGLLELVGVWTGVLAPAAG